MVYGKYELLLEDSEELYVYTRTMDTEKLLVVCSFVDHEVKYDLPEEFRGVQCLISNMENDYTQTEMILKPYEAFVLK